MKVMIVNKQNIKKRLNNYIDVNFIINVICIECKGQDMLNKMKIIFIFPEIPMKLQ